MQAKHFFATLVLALGIGHPAFAQEPAAPEAQQGMQHAPAAQEQAANAMPAEAKAAPAADAPAAATPSPVAAPPAVNATAAPLPAEAAAPAEWIHSFFYEVKVTDVLLAIFTGLLVLLGRDLVRRMRDTAAAAKESATVAEQSAAIAEKSVRVAEDALISGQRAFMFIREIKTYLHHDPDTGRFHWTIHPIWANSGNTPTRGLSINTTYRLLDEPLPAGYAFPDAHEDLIPTIAGPRSMVEAVSGTLSSEDLAAVKEGKKFFYIRGWAEYHDIFEGTKKRVTRFCNQLIEVDGDPAAPINEHNPLQMMFGFHTENNYAD
ncbi:MAG TPA: hypothetical protein VEB70_02085 [Noviherbaspirillum sp.]|nr:hypothetical protein [Noviherbaspirillum sp.]